MVLPLYLIIWYITGFFNLMLVYSLIYILKIKWQWVAGATAATVLPVVLANMFVSDPKVLPLLPMLVGIVVLAIITLKDKSDDENWEWTLTSWGFAKQIMPLLAVGVVTAGFLLGSTHDGHTIAGVIPNSWIAYLVGGNSIFANFLHRLWEHSCILPR